jgi:hypothetical protein
MPAIRLRSLEFYANGPHRKKLSRIVKAVPSRSRHLKLSTPGYSAGPLLRRNADCAVRDVLDDGLSLACTSQREHSGEANAADVAECRLAPRLSRSISQTAMPATVRPSRKGRRDPSTADEGGSHERTR